jgi:hypothetical protein
MPDEMTEDERALRTASVELADPLGGVLRSVLALLDAARKERDEARQLLDDTEALVWKSSRWLNDSTEWGGDELLGPQWQALWNRKTW